LGGGPPPGGGGGEPPFGGGGGPRTPLFFNNKRGQGGQGSTGDGEDSVVMISSYSSMPWRPLLHAKPNGGGWLTFLRRAIWGRGPIGIWGWGPIFDPNPFFDPNPPPPFSRFGDFGGARGGGILGGHCGEPTQYGFWGGSPPGGGGVKPHLGVSEGEKVSEGLTKTRGGPGHHFFLIINGAKGVRVQQGTGRIVS